MKPRTLIIAISAILVLFPIAMTKFCWDSVKGSFFGYTLMDVLNVLFTVLIGLAVTIYLSHTLSNSAKRLEILVENLNNLQNFYSCIIITISNSSQKILTDTSKAELLRLFKFASNELHNLKEYLIVEVADKNYIQGILLKIKEEHFSLKETITDAPFKAEQAITENDINSSAVHFYSIKQKIQQIKLHLYK